jgi:hypothetical protein
MYFAASLIVVSVFAAETPTLITGPKFRSELQRPLAAKWEQTELREVLRGIGSARNMAIVLDRRLDPQQRVTLTLGNESMLAGLERLALDHAAGLSTPEPLVYFGPVESARWLRTAIAHAEESLQFEGLRINSSRREALQRRKPVSWNDLTPPRTILEQLGKSYGLELNGLDQVPHDLWFSGTWPPVSAAEALHVLLIQFGLSFEWAPGGGAVLLIPWEPPTMIERTYPLGKNRDPLEWAAEWRTRLPDAEIEAVGTQLRLRGRWEDHEAYRTPATTTPRPAPNNPLAKRVFTLKVDRVPVRAILAELARSGITIEQDPAALKQANVDFEQPITLDAQRLPTTEFLAKILEGSGARAVLRGETIVILPR